jgi:hypothetical protein
MGGIKTDRCTAITDATNKTFARGTLLAKVTASGKLAVLNSTAEDGTAVPFGILVNDIDVESADAVCDVYVRGEFNQNEVIVPEGYSVADYKDTLRNIGIYLADAVEEI